MGNAIIKCCLAKTRNDRTVPTVILDQTLWLGTEKTMIPPKTVSYYNDKIRTPILPKKESSQNCAAWSAKC